MDINLSLSAAPGIISNKLVVAIYEASSPTVVVDYQVFNAPHTSARNITFTGANPTVYIVKTWENSASAPGGTIRHQFIYDPSFSNAEIRFDEFLIVGETSGFEAGGNSYAQADLEGWDYALELRQSFGTLRPDVEWQKTTSPVGWQLLMDYTFQPQEVWIMRFYPKITVVTPSVQSGGASLFGSVKIITADTSLSNTDMGKAIWLKGTNPALNLTLPDITTVLENRIIAVFSQGGFHINAAIKAYGTDKIDWLGGNLTEVVIGQSEQIQIFKWVNPSDTAEYNWKVLIAEGNFKTVGEKIYTDLMRPINTIFADGSLLSRTAYKRLWNYVQSLDASDLVSDATWSGGIAQQGKYSTGDGSTTFRIPKIYNTGYLRGVDNVTRKAGAYQADDVKPHNHAINTTQTPASSNSISDPMRGSATGTANTRGSEATPPTDNKTVKLSTGTETTPKNYAQFIMIRI